MLPITIHNLNSFCILPFYLAGTRLVQRAAAPAWEAIPAPLQYPALSTLQGAGRGAAGALGAGLPVGGSWSAGGRDKHYIFTRGSSTFHACSPVTSPWPGGGYGCPPGPVRCGWDSLRLGSLCDEGFECLTSSARAAICLIGCAADGTNA